MKKTLAVVSVILVSACSKSPEPVVATPAPTTTPAPTAVATPTATPTPAATPIQAATTPESTPTATPAVKTDDKTVTTQINEWCAVTTPVNAKIGDAVEIKVALKNVKAPTKVDCHMHFKKEGGEYGGFWVYAPPQDVSADGSFTFNFTLTEKEGAVTAVPTVFLSPDGEFAHQTANCAGGEFPVSR